MSYPPLTLPVDEEAILINLDCTVGLKGSTFLPKKNNKELKNPTLTHTDTHSTGDPLHCRTFAQELV
jgi:hypothetical protein